MLSRSSYEMLRSTRRVPTIISVTLTFKSTHQARSFIKNFVPRVNDQQKEGPQDNKIVVPNVNQPPSETVFVDHEGTFSKDAKDEVEVPLLLRLWREYFVRYALITMVGLTVLWIIYDVTDWFSSMTIKGTAKWMFSTGFILGIAFTLGATRLKQYFTIRSTSVYQAALRKVLSDSRVTSRMATPLQPGKFRAYAYEYPDMKNMYDVPWTRKIQFWRPPRMQMMFQIQDQKGQIADVTLEVSKRPGKKNILSDRFKFHQLSVELPNNEVINIKGEKVDYDPKKGLF